MGNIELLALPVGTLAPLAAGYIGYRIAYCGHDGAHTATDSIFLSLIFALIAKLVMLAFGGWVIVGVLFGLAASVAAAALWRMWGAPQGLHWMRALRISDHDRGRNVWESMISRQNLPPATQLRVTLKNGRELMCDDLSQFVTAPMGACLLGPDGSVALYVTSHRKDGGDWVDVAGDTTDKNYGIEMTFIPASEIARARIRMRA